MTKLDDLQIKAPVPRPKRRRRFPWVPVVALIFLTAVLLYFQRAELSDLLRAGEGPPPSAETLVDEPPASAPAGPAGSISAAGYLEIIPPGPVIISTLVAGRVLNISAIPGQAAKSGEVIARLDSGLLEQESAVLRSRVELAHRRLERLRAGFRSEEIEEAEAELSSLQARLTQTKADWERGSRLFDSGVIARQQLDALQAAQQQAQADFAAGEARLRLLKAGTRSEDLSIAEAELASSEAELQQVQWEIAQCTMRTAMSGVVLEQFVQPGDWVTPGTDDPRSGAILSIFDPAQLQAWVDVNQRDSGGLFVGQQAELQTDALPNRPVAAFIDRIMPQANLQKNTVQVKLTIPEPPADFRPDLSVKVMFLPADKPAAATLEATSPRTELDNG